MEVLEEGLLMGYIDDDEIKVQNQTSNFFFNNFM